MKIELSEIAEYLNDIYISTFSNDYCVFGQLICFLSNEVSESGVVNKYDCGLFLGHIEGRLTSCDYIGAMVYFRMMVEEHDVLYDFFSSDDLRDKVLEKETK